MRTSLSKLFSASDSIQDLLKLHFSHEVTSPKVLNAILKSFSNLFFNLAEISRTSTKVTTFYRHLIPTFPPLMTLTFGLFWLGCTYKGKGNSQMELAIVAFDFPVIRISQITGWSHLTPHFQFFACTFMTPRCYQIRVWLHSVSTAAGLNSAASTMQRRITLRRQWCSKL